MAPITPLAQDHVCLYSSPDPQNIFAYSPGICRLPSGRLIATCDLGGPGVEKLDGPLGEYKESSRFWQGQVWVSDDHGNTWRHVHTFTFLHARPFIAGNRVYIIGHRGDLTIISSDDEGETWSDPIQLSKEQRWHQAPCNVHYANDCVYLVMERHTRDMIRSWKVGEVAPVLMRGKCNSDLLQSDNWTFASELSFYDIVDNSTNAPELQMVGIPFWDCPYPHGGDVAEGRNCAPIGWLETNVIQFTDPKHIWYDPQGRTLHLWARAHTGGTGYACIAKVIEEEPGQGTMTTMLEKVPSGKTILYIPCPGGQMKFHVLYDEQTELYWLLSTQAIDSMCRPDRLAEKRFNLPNNERCRLQLHFSKNMVDWCFAGLIAAGEADNASRHYASMAVDGDNLLILSRSGTPEAQSAHNGNLITLHKVNDFRSLVY